MKLPVYLYGHPVLRNVSDDIDQGYEGFEQLVADMYACMYASEGVGLAAPQIGRNIRLIVIDGTVVADTFPECADLKLTLVNPRLEVLDDGEKVSRPEGCLSLPGISESVPRKEKVRLTWLDEQFQPHEQVFEGFAARIIQHEYDHLEGRLFIDHISPIRKQLIRAKLNNIVAGRIRVDYPVKPAPRKK